MWSRIKQKNSFFLLPWIACFIFVTSSNADTRGFISKLHPRSKQMMHAIGDTYQGGIIFWTTPDLQHGLIAAKSDLADSLIWGDIGVQVHAVDDGIYKGLLNTVLMQSQLTGQNSAAFAVMSYSIQADGLTACILNSSLDECYGDWYLPSKLELYLMYQQKNVIGGFLDAYYWSSLEESENNAWVEYFGDGEQRADVKNIPYQVRVIRAY